jgi:gluconokinase
VPALNIPLALAIDLGTSSVRAAIFDAAGRERAGVKHKYAWHRTHDGGVEADIATLFDTTCTAVDAVLDQAQEFAGDIVAVGFDTFWHGLLGLDASGRPLTPVYPWNDTRARAAAALLRERLDAAAVHARTGTFLHPSYPAAKIKWLMLSQPGLARSVAHWCSPGEYIERRLFGDLRVSMSMASGTGLLDQHSMAWDEEMLDAVGVSGSTLAPIADIDVAFTNLRSEYAARWPALARVPWIPALGDGACANIGSNCTDESAIALSLGTGGALRVLTRSAVVPTQGLWQYRLDRGRALIGSAISNGGSVYAWLRETLRLPDLQTLEKSIAALDADAHGLTMLPFLAGERGPDWPLDARAALVGMSADTKPEEIVRAGLESVALRLARIHSLVRGCFPDALGIVADGGALRDSHAWAQIIADAIGEPLQMSPILEATSRGVALVALESAGFKTEPEILQPRITLQPDLRSHERYLIALRRQEALERDLD